MTISSTSSAASNAADMAAFRKQLFQKTDANNDGSIDKTELATALKNAPKKPDGDASDTPDAESLFKTLDSNGDGKITESEMDSGLKQKEAQNGGKAGAPPAGKPPGGAPPAGGGGGKAASSSSSSSSSNKVYDKKDTNKDGTVSAAEEQAYDLKHPEAAKKASDTDADEAVTTPNEDGTGQVINAKV